MRALVIEDDPHLRGQVTQMFADEGFAVDQAADGENGLYMATEYPVDIAIVDLGLPGASGMDWLKALRAAGNPADVILMTAFADMDTAIAALRSGAADFIVKPFRVDQVLNAIRRCFNQARLARENYLLRRELDKYTIHKDFIGESEAMKKVMALVARVAPMPYLIADVSMVMIVSRATSSSHVQVTVDSNRDSIARSGTTRSDSCSKLLLQCAECTGWSIVTRRAYLGLRPQATTQTLLRSYEKTRPGSAEPGRVPLH